MNFVSRKGPALQLSSQGRAIDEHAFAMPGAVPIIEGRNGSQHVIGCPLCYVLTRRRMLAGMSAAALSAVSSVPETQAAAQAAGQSSATPNAAARPVIDFHCHMIEPSLAAAGEIPNGPAVSTLVRQQTDVAMRLEEMERRGIDYSVVSHNSVMQGITWGGARQDLDVFKRINDRLAEDYVAAHPNRLMGAFSLPTQDLDIALPEMERAVTKLGLKVLQISSCTADGVYYGDPRMDPFWEAVQAFDVTVFIHPHGQMKDPPLDQFLLNVAVGQSIEEVKVMSSLIYQGVFDKFPRLKILMAHGGGFLPHYPGRIDRNQIAAPFKREHPSDYFKSFYYDSCVYAPSVMAEVIRIVGADRIVLGSDYPFGPADPIATLRATPGLSDADMETILRKTPSMLLGL